MPNSRTETLTVKVDSPFPSDRMQQLIAEGWSLREASTKKQKRSDPRGDKWTTKVITATFTRTIDA